MIQAETLLGEMTGRGITAVTGVPCSFLTPIINAVITDPSVRYLAATQEGEAAALAAGAWLGGGLGCVISQNSGLGNMVNPLTSLLNTAGIPALLLVTWRGQPGRPDEPQHGLMGEITLPLLELMHVRSTVLNEDPDALRRTMETAFAAMRVHELPYGIVVPKGVVADEPLLEPEVVRRTSAVIRHGTTDRGPSRAEVLEELLAAATPDAAIVSTTGYTSRELYTLDDREQHFYMVGAMGSAIAVGLGVSLHTPRPTIVVDGDGALLMRMGSLATVGAHGGSNLVHVVLDNGVHDSTGGQRTLSGIVDVPAAAAACGYGQVHVCATAEHFSTALRSALAGQGPSLIYLPIRPGSMSDLGRPKVTPIEVARRFRSFVTSQARIEVGVS